jgi:hypothetical protein
LRHLARLDSRPDRSPDLVRRIDPWGEGAGRAYGGAQVGERVAAALAGAQVSGRRGSLVGREQVVDQVVEAVPGQVLVQSYAYIAMLSNVIKQPDGF